MRFSLLTCLLLALSPTSARAIDGVLEINKACVPSGCFPNDGAGMPVSISAAGSYRLTSNLTGAVGVNGIEISVPAGGPGVTLDLNGFEIAGVSGSLDGILVTNANTRSVTVRDGTVRQFGGDGIDLLLATDALVEGAHARENGGRGIALDRGVVRNSVARANGGHGIAAYSAGSVDGCLAEFNTGPGSAGILAVGGSVRGSIAQANSGVGISIYAGSISGCRAVGNASFGILASRSTVRDATASFNTQAGIYVDLGTVVDSTIISNPGGCIYVLNESRVAGNTCSGQGAALPGTGIDVAGTRNRIDGNNATNNMTGIRLTGTSNLLIRNSASGNGFNYVIGAGNMAGPVIGSGTIATDSNPHANYVQ